MKKRIAWFLIISLGCCVLASCTAAENKVEERNSSTETVKSEKTAEGEKGEKTIDPMASAEHRETVTVAISREPKTLLPYESNDTGTAPITHQYCEALLTTDTQSNLVPCLAESWKQLDDTHYQFNLRKGVKFHNGADFTAEDVLFTLQKCVESPATSSSVGPIDIENSEIVNDFTIIVALNEPCPAFLKLMSLDVAGIVCKSAMEADPEAYATTPLGTGPFKFVEWKKGDYVKFDANENWWGGKINFDHLMLRYIPEGTTRAIEAESGGVDIAHITITDVENAANSSKVILIKQPIQNTSFLSFNCKVKPFDDVRVRRAISLAIDCEAIVKATYGEHSSLAKSFLSPVTFGYYEAESEYIGYKPEKAKELLSEAGLPDGFECELISNGNQGVAEMIQSYLASVGIKVKLNVTDFANWLDSLVNGKQQMYIGGWTVPSGDPTEAFTYFDSANLGQGGNRSFYVNSEADKLIHQINTETNEETRLKVCADLQQMLADECVTIGLNVGYSYWECGKKINNFQILTTQSPNYARITFSK